ncbi:MAG: hypothetical protein HKN13_03905, partial [Rhodothermales bacterium]|nr:hypothetical protein [Rhodothermales bacterium]
MTNFLFRNGDPPYREHHEEWLITALIKADTDSVFALLGAGKGNLKSLNSAPLEALSEPRVEENIPDAGRSQAFRRQDSDWLQVTSFRAGMTLMENAKAISKKLSTTVYLTCDTEDGFSYQFYDTGKLIESYQRSSEDA